MEPELQSLLVLNDRKTFGERQSLPPETEVCVCIYVFGCPWGGKPLAREGCFQPVWGCKCMALNVWKHRVGWIWLPRRFVRDGAWSAAEPQDQSFPSVGGAHRQTLWARGVLPSLVARPCSLGLGVSGFGVGKEAEKWNEARRLHRESFIRYIFVFQVPIISRKLLLKSPPFTLSPN